MMKVSVGQRILAAIASITVTMGVAQGMVELAQHEPGSRGMTRGAAPQAKIVCAPVRAPRAMLGTGGASAATGVQG